MNEQVWYLRTQDETFGPETRDKLIEWAQLGRIQPGQSVSDDNVIWQRVEDVPFLDMRFSIDIGDGNPRGPFNRAAAEALLASGRLTPAAKMVEVREPFPEETPPVAEETPVVEETPPIVEKTLLVEEELPFAETSPAVEETPPVVDAVVPPQAAQPEEQVVEKVVEKIVEKVVVDETRVKQLECELAESDSKLVTLEARVAEMRAQMSVSTENENLLQQKLKASTDECAALQERLSAAEARATDLQTRLTETEGRLATSEGKVTETSVKLEAAEAKATDLAAKIAATENALAETEGRRTALEGRVTSLERELADEKTQCEKKIADAASRETKYLEQIQSLEDALRRLPQTASEVADIQAAMYKIMSDEEAELVDLIAAEKQEFDQFKARHMARIDRLTERRRIILKRSGGSIEGMTRKALIERPEDPRTTQLRKDLEALQHTYDLARVDYETKLREQGELLRALQTEQARSVGKLRDVTQLQAEAQALREKLQLTEKELLNTRQKCEDLQQREATSRQTLLARLETLESPSIAAPAKLETNQSREARQVKLPSWMRLKR